MVRVCIYINDFTLTTLDIVRGKLPRSTAIRKIIENIHEADPFWLKNLLAQEQKQP
jgi:hypothetical protein